MFCFIIDDDVHFQKLLSVRLRSWNPDIEISTASSLESANRFLESLNKSIDLVVLDQHLPDGLGAKILEHPKISASTVLAVSADLAPELPGSTVLAGAAHFLAKRQISEPLFIPLVEALITRHRIQRELKNSETRKTKLETIRTLANTLRHEINNPLGAVLGGAYLLRTSASQEIPKEQLETIKLIEESGKRINHVLNQICAAAEIEEATKGSEQVFQIPGDPKWEE